MKIITCFIFRKRDDVFVVTVDEFRELAGLISSHADLIVMPFTCADVLFQRHQASE